nr:hypothetical protein Iba_chr09eCG9040 [Ipomoea batatas]
MLPESKFVLNPNGSSCRDVKVRNSKHPQFQCSTSCLRCLRLSVELTHRLTGAAPQRSVAHSARSMASATEFSAHSESVSDSHRRTIGNAYGGVTNDRQSC